MRGHSDVEAIGPAPERLQFQFTPRRLRDFVDPDHLLIRIDEQFDFSELVAPLEDRYCPDNGRPAIQTVSRAEGRLKNGKEFDAGYSLVALLAYDRKPETLTQGQLAGTRCYSHGEIIAGLIPPSSPLQDDFEYTETVERPECPDPYKIGSTAGRPGSRGEMAKAWEDAKEKSQRVRESEISVYTTKARELTAEGDNFALKADVPDLLEEHGPGVYTVILMASLADDPGDEVEIISEFFIFHEVRPQRTYGQGTRAAQFSLTPEESP